MGSRSRKRSRGLVGQGFREAPSPAEAARAAALETAAGPREIPATAPAPDLRKAAAPAPSARAARNEAKNQAIRDSLPTLGPDDPLPWSLRISVAITAFIGLGQIIGFAAGLEVDGKAPSAGGVIGFAGLMLIASAGMYKRRYWAVLGFQTLLALLVVFFAVVLMAASNLLALVVCLFFIFGPGFLFWKLVRVLARLQMPERPGA